MPGAKGTPWRNSLRKLTGFWSVLLINRKIVMRISRRLYGKVLADFFERVHNLGEGKALLATDTKRLDFGENRGT